MMDKKALVEKIGVLLEGLQESYQRISEGTEQLNPLEVELFEVNSIYFSEHTKILTKLEQETAGTAAEGQQEPEEQFEQENEDAHRDEVAAQVENPEVEETKFTPQTKADDVDPENTDETDEADDAESANEQEEDQEEPDTNGDDQEEQADQDLENENETSSDSDTDVETPVAEEASAEEESEVSEDAKDQSSHAEEDQTERRSNEIKSSAPEESHTDGQADPNNVQEEAEVEDKEAASEEVEERELPMEEADHKEADAERERQTFRFNFTPEEPEKQESFRDPDSPQDSADLDQGPDFKGPEAQSQEVHIASKEVSIEAPSEPAEEPVSQHSTQQNGAAPTPAGLNSLQQQASKERPMSLNERISAQRRQQGQSLVGGQAKPELKRIKDIKSAVSLNDKLLFIKDLFNGYSLAYSEAMELLNRFGNFEEADQFLQNNYAAKNNWGTKKETVNKLYDILRKRYGT